MTPSRTTQKAAVGTHHIGTAHVDDRTRSFSFSFSSRRGALTRDDAREPKDAAGNAF